MSDQSPTDPRPTTPTPASRVPEKVSLDGLEDRWGGVWHDQGTYAFDRTATREQVYSIDTPPPTVSGSLHVGHVFKTCPTCSDPETVGGGVSIEYTCSRVAVRSNA